MSEAINQWFQSKVKVDGLIAAGLIYPGRDPIVRTNSTDLPDASLEALCRAVGDMVDTATDHYPNALRLRWVFDESYCYAMPRADGICLVLLTTRDVQGEEHLGELAKQFHAL